MVYLNYKVKYSDGGKSFALMHCVVPPCYSPATVCRNSVKVSDKYDKAVDNTSVELRHNDTSGATAFTSLSIKK